VSVCTLCGLVAAQNDIRLLYKKIEEGADVNFVFGDAYGCPEGYTPLMAAAHRSRLECCKALLRAGADPNFCNSAADLVIFWGIDGGVEIVKLLFEVRLCGANVRTATQGASLAGAVPRGDAHLAARAHWVVPPAARSTGAIWTRTRPRTGLRCPTQRQRASTA
jgi:hypothetical protein